MEFRKFNSIENSYQIKSVWYALEALEWYNDFVVQEKVHWSNFAFYVSKDWIKCAKRNSFLEDWDSFFWFQEVLEEHKETLKSMHDDMWKDFIVFWELYWRWVQKEVEYCDNKRFIAFDIYVWEDVEDFLSVSICEHLFHIHWLPFTETLFRWTLDECFWYDINKNSLLYDELNDDKPTFEKWDNIWEWIVIRPWINKAMANWNRIIFKKKTEKFSEKKAPDKVLVDNKDYSEYNNYITKTRLDNVISKEWNITEKKEMPKYAWLLVKDILEEIQKEKWSTDYVLQSWAKKYIFKKCIQLILTNCF